LRFVFLVSHFLFLDSVHSRSDAGESSEGNDFLSPLPPSLSVPPPLPPLVHLVNDLPTPIKSSLKKPNNNNLTFVSSPSPSISSTNNRNHSNLQTKENPIHSNTTTTTSLATPSHLMTALPSSVTAEGLLLSSNRPHQPTSTSSTRKASTGAAHTMMSALEFLSPQQQRAVRYSAPGSSDLKANHTSSKRLFSSPFAKTSSGNKNTAQKKDDNDGDICL
jgi:hypothetical protein